MLFSEFLITAHLLTAINQALLSGVGLELCRVSGPIKFNPTKMVGLILSGRVQVRTGQFDKIAGENE